MIEKFEQMPQGFQIFVVGLVLLFALGCGLYVLNLAAPYQNSRPEPQSEPKRNVESFVNVVTACQLEATSRLRNPETAEPQSITDIDESTQYSVSNGKAVLKSWIKSESDIGLKIKMRYICNVNQDGSGVVNLGFITQ